MLFRSVSSVLLGAACVLALSACGEDGPTRDPSPASSREGRGPLKVAAGFYPLYEAAREIGGDDAEVTNLTPVDSGPHDLELDARAAAAIEEAGLVVYLGRGFQPEVERAVAGRDAGTLDVLTTQELRPAQAGIPGVRGEVDGEKLEGDADPHVWVDPGRFVEMTDAIAEAMIAADPSRRATFEANLARYRASLTALDGEFERSLADCSTRTLVTSHAAFGYLADRYGLVQAPIAGISPDEEPDPQSLAAVAKRAKADGVKTVFFETLVPKALSQTVAEEIGATTDALDPVEGLTEESERAGASYVSIQRDNLRRLAKGLGCTA